MIQERLFALQDEKYREFQRSLIPGLPRENIIGIRIPAMRKLAKEFVKAPEAAVFSPASSNFLDTARITTSLNEYSRREPEP